MKINDIEFGGNHSIKTLKETSWDSKGDAYMTDCEKRVIDFDQAKTNYCNDLGKSEEYADSADSLCFTADKNKFYLIEFKNGDFSSKDITKKAKDSAFVLSGIMKKDVNCIRNSVILVLVYNGEVRKIETRDKIAIAKANRGKGDFAVFGLEKLKGFYYDKILVYEKEQFRKSYIINEIVSIS